MYNRAFSLYSESRIFRNKRCNFKGNSETMTATSEHKEKLLKELSGAWEDVDENLAEKVLGSRTITEKDLSFE